MSFARIALPMLQLPLNLVNGYLLKTGSISEPVGENSVPVQMWIHVGINEEKIGYWDDARTISIYTCEGDWSKATSTPIYNGMIKDNISEKGFLKICGIYLKKIFWLWTEGTSQSEYYGIGTDKISGFMYDTPISVFLENSYATRDAIRWIMHSFNLLILILIWLGLIPSFKGGNSYSQILPAIIVLGFIAFYTVWEIKPRYIYIVYPHLLLMACHGMTAALSKAKVLIKKT